jgi:hypothetical protein
MSFVKGHLRKDGSWVESHYRINGNKKYGTGAKNSGCLFALMLILFTFLLVTCTKKQTCEKWRFYSKCYPKNNRTFCNNPNPPNYIDGTFCGDELKGLYPGVEITLQDGPDALLVRHFVQKLQ